MCEADVNIKGTLVQLIIPSGDTEGTRANFLREQSFEHISRALALQPQVTVYNEALRACIY